MSGAEGRGHLRGKVTDASLVHEGGRNVLLELLLKPNFSSRLLLQMVQAMHIASALSQVSTLARSERGLNRGMDTPVSHWRRTLRHEIQWPGTDWRTLEVEGIGPVLSATPNPLWYQFKLGGQAVDPPQPGPKGYHDSQSLGISPVMAVPLLSGTDDKSEALMDSSLPRPERWPDHGCFCDICGMRLESRMFDHWNASTFFHCSNSPDTLAHTELKIKNS
ncbi:uncharacterized protein BDR25DRAFT_353300 [Lindgomyces ingoldianus]|uniref:Uncharacterized protein n=1 Tax=Lindgomyces ingoldianus TaxID=673940 RepID=A0ACB6R162_9PLEO|nr:uncharacterized protein BDR25DRAFT_353300 [Lindgomyces ingoldianus]KAF2472993.1 hypothetical protein BDR25DRAFT_353300 [Lindgomyces ingoldianus]